MANSISHPNSLVRVLRISFSLMLSETVAFMIPPLLAVGLVDAGEDLLLSALAAAAPALGVVGGIPLVPFIVRRIGPRQAFAAGAAVLLVALLFYVMANVTRAYPLWVIAGVVIGFGQAIRWIVADAAVARVADGGNRGRLMSIHETMRSAAIGVGPGFVALEAADLSIGLFVAGSFASLALLTSAAVPAGEEAVQHGRRSRNPFALVPVAAAAAAFVGGALEAAAGTSVPVYGLGLGLGAGAAAALASASGFGNLATQYPVGLTMDRLGLPIASVPVAAITALAALAIPQVLVEGEFALALMFLFGGFAGAFYTLAIVEATGDQSNPTATVAVVALLYTFGTFTGPIAGNISILLAPGVGLPLLLALAALAAILPRLTTSAAARRDLG